MNGGKISRMWEQNELINLTLQGIKRMLQISNENVTVKRKMSCEMRSIICNRKKNVFEIVLPLN